MNLHLIGPLLLLLGAVADVTSTQAALRRGAQEANPLVVAVLGLRFPWWHHAGLYVLIATALGALWRFGSSGEWWIGAVLFGVLGMVGLLVARHNGQVGR